MPRFCVKPTIRCLNYLVMNLAFFVGFSSSGLLSKLYLEKLSLYPSWLGTLVTNPLHNMTQEIQSSKDEEDTQS